MILTPDELEALSKMWRAFQMDAVADTLAAYADIVQKVAEMGRDGYFNGQCVFCDADWPTDHHPGCPYLVARELRGLQ